jgi:hypothetical protein
MSSISDIAIAESVMKRIDESFDKLITRLQEENERQRKFYLDLVKAGSEATLNGVKQVEGYTLK